MKVAHGEENVKGSRGLGETAAFTINASAKAFQILSSGMYSDKIRAVLREIGCNAADAHIEAGIADRPFRVKIPNSLDDQFYVRDWGPGLSHEGVMGLYTSYFTSTKQTTNEQTGAFGLGSKSPFSYTKQFTVVSTHGGVKRTYALYVSNTGAPNVSLLSEEEPEADWESGLQVGFAVKPTDAVEFANKAQDVYKWFKVAPEMRGVGAIKPVKYRHKEAGYGLLEREQHEADQTHVVMGNVSYPVKLESLDVKDPYNDDHAAKDIVNYSHHMKGLVLFLPIGAVQVTASREHLEYDPASKKELRDRLRDTSRGAASETIEALRTAVTGGWAERCAAKQAVDLLLPGGHYRFGLVAAAMGLKPAEIKLVEPFVDSDTVVIPTDGVVKESRTYVVRKSANRKRGFGVFNSKDYSGRRLTVNPSTTVLAGVAKRAQSRAMRAVAEDHFEQVLVVTRMVDDNKTSESTVVAEAQAVAKKLGLEVKSIADFEPLELAKAVGKRKGKWKPQLPDLEEFECYSTTGKSRFSNMLLPDLEDKLYVCRRDVTKWRNTKEFVRIFNTSAEDDRSIALREWNEIWDGYVALQKKVKLPGAPAEAAIVYAGQVKSIGLPQLGWRNAYDAIAEYLKRPELKVELLKGVKKAHIVAPENIHEACQAGWLSAIAWYVGHADENKRWLMPRLQQLGLDATVKSMLAVGKKDKGGEVPPEVQGYQQLVSEFRLTDELAGDVKTALTVEDVDAAFEKRFPRAALIDTQMLREHQDKTRDMITFILDKEE